MTDDTRPRRAAELIEKRLHDALAPGEAAELDRLAEADPSVRADLHASLEEERAMQCLFLESPTAPFDFDRARAAVRRKLATERRVLLSLAGSVLVTALIVLAVMWPTPDWRLISWCTGLPLSPVLIWSLWRWREAAAFARALREGPDAIATSYRSHLRRARLEFTISGAACALVCLGMAVWLIDMLAAGNWVLAAVALCFVAFFLDTGLRHLWTRPARERHERVITGEDNPA